MLTQRVAFVLIYRGGRHLHADETSARVPSAIYWAHVASNDLLTLLDCHKTRGMEAVTDMAVLPLFKGVLVSDRYKTYWSIDGTGHALCLAHNAEPAIMRCGRQKALWQKEDDLEPSA